MIILKVLIYSQLQRTREVRQRLNAEFRRTAVHRVQAVYSAQASAAPVLSRIESFRAVKSDWKQHLMPDTYAVRRFFHTPVPPTLTDAFVVDMWLISTGALHKNRFSTKTATVDDIIQALVYIQYIPQGHLIGYRPSADKQFVDSLTDGEIRTLAAEVIAYARRYGLRNGK